MVPVLSAFYFGSVEHYRLLAKWTIIGASLDPGMHVDRQDHCKHWPMDMVMVPIELR